jgi:hypothetical protein
MLPPGSRVIHRDGLPWLVLSYATDERTGARSCDPVDLDTVKAKIVALLNAADLPSEWKA